MIQPRVIPCLLLKERGLVKTIKFKNPKYLGDPINIVRIFNDKEVDELILLDITATEEGRGPAYEILSNITTECFMPLAYGGGIGSLEDIKKLLGIGIEKVVLNTSAVEKSDLVTRAAEFAGTQAVVVSMDIKKAPLAGYEVYTHGGKKRTGLDPVGHAVEMEKRGAGEIFLTSMDRDGTMQGYDLKLIQSITRAVHIPVVACGGAGSLQHLVDSIEIGGASAAAAGSLFVFQGPLRAVLISYPSPDKMNSLFNKKMPTER